MAPPRKYLAVMLFVTAAIAAAPSAAQAAEAPAAAPASWYGYQTFASDATAVALTLVAAGTDTKALAYGAVGLYILGGPTVHALHRRPVAAVTSLSLRILLPLALAGLGAVSADCSMRVVNDENCDFGEKLVGLAVGMTAAVIIDGAGVAWDRRAAPAPAAPESPAARAASSVAEHLSLSPLPLRAGGGLVFSGLF